MIKQAERLKKQIKFQQQQQSPDQKIVQQEAPVPVKFVQPVGSLPSQLYRRMGLSMPRWLFWLLTIAVGITLSGLLVSSLALWTPLWSDIDRTDEELGMGGTDAEKTPLPGEIWSNISQYKLMRPMNILVMGIEPVRGSVDGSPESFAGKSDSMLLIRFNPDQKSVRVLSLPRDTMIAIPESKTLTKLSEANAQGGPVLAARVVSRTLSNAPIDRYIRISTGGLRQLVDQLGGVEVFVPRAMEYKDSTGNFSINLVSGWQNLNGEQAEQFLRFREANMGDLPRVQRQQALLMGIRERLFSPTVLPRLPQIIHSMGKYFDTNLKVEEMMALVNFSLNLERDNFQMTILPGIFSRLSADPNSYWLDLTGRVDLLTNYTGVVIGGLKPDTRPVNSLKIAIQNASNQPQLSDTVMNSLKQKGFSKAYTVGNWPDSHSETKIIAQKGNRQAAEKLQQILGIGTIEVSATGDLESDLTVRIGKDWK